MNFAIHVIIWASLLRHRCKCDQKIAGFRSAMGLSSSWPYVHKIPRLGSSFLLKVTCDPLVFCLVLCFSNWENTVDRPVKLPACVTAYIAQLWHDFKTNYPSGMTVVCHKYVQLCLNVLESCTSEVCPVLFNLKMLCTCTSSCTSLARSRRPNINLSISDESCRVYVDPWSNYIQCIVVPFYKKFLALLHAIYQQKAWWMFV